MKNIDRRLSVAPMMDWTDRHDRYFLRLLSRHTLLYTEMLTTGALLHGDQERFLKFDETEHPVALQLGGSDPAALSECARIGESSGYDEINLNLGCPSDRVQNGSFGACLMAEPELVTEAVGEMVQAVSIPVTVKTRIGINDIEDYEYLHAFVDQVKASGCTTFIIHARNAILSGLSPKQNREIPPLKYDFVYRLKKDFPQLDIIINGGIKTLDSVIEHLNHLDGAMIGREAYQNPYVLAEADALIFGDGSTAPSRAEILDQFIEYAEREVRCGTPLKHMTRHILGLYHGQPGARRFRRHLSENAHLPDAKPDIVREAGALVLH